MIMMCYFRSLRGCQPRKHVVRNLGPGLEMDTRIAEFLVYSYLRLGTSCLCIATMPLYHSYGASRPLGTVFEGNAAHRIF